MALPVNGRMIQNKCRLVLPLVVGLDYVCSLIIVNYFQISDQTNAVPECLEIQFCFSKRSSMSVLWLCRGEVAMAIPDMEYCSLV